MFQISVIWLKFEFVYLFFNYVEYIVMKLFDGDVLPKQLFKVTTFGQPCDVSEKSV